jgi:hypothetical protein
MGKDRHIFFSSLLLSCALTIFLIPSVSYGTDSNSLWATEMYAGGQADTRGQSYSYLGAGLDRNVTENFALTGKVFLEYLTYKYMTNDMQVDANAPGGRLMFGAKYFRSDLFLTLSAGVSTRDTSLSPDDKGSDVRGTRIGAAVEAMLWKKLSEKFSTEWLGSYNSSDDSLWGRARFKYLLPWFLSSERQRILIGIEGIAQGNHEYSSYQAGTTVELQRIKENYSILLSTGYRTNDSIPNSAYMGLEFYHRF